VVVTCPEQLPTLLESLSAVGSVALDIETTGPDPRKHRLRLLTLATTARTWVIDAAAVSIQSLLPILADKHLIAHNAAFDLGFLAQQGFIPSLVTCTMLLSQLLHAGRVELKHSLNEVAARELGIALTKEQQKSDWSGSLSREQLEYAGRDAAVLLPLHARLQKQIQEAGLSQVAAIELSCLPAMVWLSNAGVPFDTAAWQNLVAENAAEVAAKLAVLNQTAPPHPAAELGGTWNWNSPLQIQRAFQLAGVALESTGDELLARCAHPLAVALREYRAVRKLQTAYAQTWLSHVHDGRLYVSWRQIGSKAGRMSCREPNVQQMPRDPRYRRCITAPPGRVLVKADYSQIELRLAAKIAEEQRMLAGYQAGEDLHTLTSQQLRSAAAVTIEDRQLAKVVNFGLIYGMGPARLQPHARTQYGIELTEKEAREYRARFFATYLGLKQWDANQSEGAVDTRTLSGRRRIGVTAFTEKLNTPVQGSGADGLKTALALLWERRDECPDAVPVIVVHDEIVIECPAEQAEAAAAWLKQAMEDGMQPFTAPIRAEVETKAGPTWGG
jgi:DNA polymerase-1